MDVKALEKIIHNGVSYGPGEIVPGLSDEEGKRLINLGAAIEEEGSRPAKKTKDAPKTK
ncbi:hypothetical protein D1872_54690 [compost metagenome]